MRRLLLPLAALLFACAPPVREYRPPCDACGVCDDDRTNDCVVDCGSEPGGTATLDECGVCSGGKTGKTACVKDCAGVFGGTAKVDDCGECAGGTTGQLACGADCAEEKGGTAWVDQCGECVGGTTEKEACKADCAGVFGGAASLDECGACTGGNTGLPACAFDCTGVPNGLATADPCGVCDANPANDCVLDCVGVGNGTAFVDNCGTCVGGTTGLNACVADCFGTWGGSARLDRCDHCSEGETGREPCKTFCEPFARSLAKSWHAHESTGSFSENVPTSRSWYGVEDRVVGGLTWLHYSSRLSLPPGKWNIQWRVATGDSPTGLTGSVKPALEADPCIEKAEIDWPRDQQAAKGEYGVSPPLQVKVSGDKVCAVEALLFNYEGFKTGYAFDWVRATPTCGAADDCPKVHRAEAACVNNECFYAADDEDRDGLCDAMDACPGGDDRKDTDGDEYPDECDCEANDKTVNPGAVELCGGRDNNCNGLFTKSEAPGEHMLSLTDSGRDNAEYYNVVSSSESPFGRILRSSGLWWLHIHHGAPVPLNPGRYGVSYRVKPRSRIPGVRLSVTSWSPVDCFRAQEVQWDAEANGFWVNTPMAEFQVTSFDCRITPRIFAEATTPSNWDFDSMTIVRLCDEVAECPEYERHQSVCERGICRYKPSFLICEP